MLNYPGVANVRRQATFRVIQCGKTYFAFTVQIDAHNVLVDDTTGANVEMSNLRVAHQAIGKTDCEAGCIKGKILAISFLGGELVHDGCLGIGNGITVHLLRDTPAIDDNQADRVCRLGVGHLHG